MTILLVQIFSLMLGAFLLGACLACLLRRGLSGARDVPVAETGLANPAGPARSASVAAAPAGVAPGRFGRALSGGDGSSVPTVLRTDQPVVEVQPPPEAEQPEPAPQAVEPVPAPQPAPAPPWRAMRPPPPALASERGPMLAPAPAPAVASSPPPEPAQDHGQSYTQIAVGAAAAAAAIAAAKARADAEAAERDAAEKEAAEKAAAERAAAQARAEAEAAERYAAEKAAAERAAAAIAAAKVRAEAEAAARDAAEKEAAERAAAERAAAQARAEAEAAAREAAEKAAAEKAAAERAAAEVEVPASEPAAPQEGADRPSRFGTPAATSLLERLAGEPVDDLTRIHGIDGALKQRLVRYGVHRFSQIAAWTAGDVWGTSRALALEDRVRRDNWIEQARILAEGGDPSRARAEKPPVAVGIAPVDGDRLNRIIGIDPAAEALLRANGVTRLAEIAAWQGEDVARFEALLGTNGRIAREGWVAQALFLTGGAPPASEPAAPDPGPVVIEAPELSEPSSEPRESYAGLLSVRSEALRGEPRPFVTSAGEVQDLKRIRGIGVLIEKRLNAAGITAYEQVANWTRADIDRISEMLDFKGRIERENWIEQARILASGGQTEFSRRVDRGDA
jgi:predicted flap endonuclease-1-like 5' DNA nuclease